MSIGDKTAVFGEADRCLDSRDKFTILALLEVCRDVFKPKRKVNDVNYKISIQWCSRLSIAIAQQSRYKKRYHVNGRALMTEYRRDQVIQALQDFVHC